MSPIIKDQNTAQYKNIFKTSSAILSSILVFLAAFGIVAPASRAYADTITLNVTNKGYFVNLSSTTGDTLTMNLTPGSSGIQTVKDTLNVKTNVKNGYNVYLSTDTTENSLVMQSAPSGVDANRTKIRSTTSNNIETNTWGYSTNNSHWAGVPAKGQEVNIKSENSATSDAGTNFDVFYGARVDGNLIAGTYENTVVYTVVADGTSLTLRGSVSPGAATTGTQLTVNVPLYANYQITADQAQVTVGGKPCTNLQIVRQDKNFMSMTCDAPQNDAGDKEVKVNLPRVSGLPISAGNVRYN